MEIVGYRKHVAAAGESFYSVAFAYYNNEFMADKLMKENESLVKTIVFKGGEELKIPVYDDIESTETLAPWRQ